MPNATAARRPKFPPSDPPPAASAVACGSRCPGCPECSLEHEEYAPLPLELHQRAAAVLRAGGTDLRVAA